MARKAAVEMQCGELLKLFEASTTASWFVDVEGCVRRANAAAREISGWTDEEMLGRQVTSFVPGPLGERILLESMHVLETRTPILGRMVHLELDGRMRWGLLDQVPALSDTGELLGLYVFATDITEQKVAEAQARERNRRLTALGRMSQSLHAAEREEETYWIFVSLLSILFSESSGCLMLAEGDALRVVSVWGTPHRFLKIRSRGDLSSLCGEPGAAGWYCASSRKGLVSWPLRYRSKLLAVVGIEVPGSDWSPASVEAYLEPDREILQMAANHYALSLVNLRMLEELRAASVRDPLTGLYNRRHMEAAFEREIERSRRRAQGLSVVMLDLDYFKRLNDSHGHVIGDQVLSRFGEMLLESVRGEDIACRFGGEEFTIILPETGIEEARSHAERLLLQTRGLELPEGVNLTASAGVASLHPEEGVNGCLSRADSALYMAKRRGRDRVVVAVAHSSSMRSA